jgi:photosystem II stability/assembly factor-like uncharacterized protein
MRAYSYIAVAVVAQVVFLPASSCATDWQAITTDLVAKEKPGYGGLSGVAVDHATGTIYIELSDRGVFRSKDQGKNWERVGKDFKGRTEQPGCLLLDPTGKSKRLLCATVYGGPVAITSVEEDNWRLIDAKCSHVDWCVVDWTDADLKFVLALKHESGGTLLVSADGGKSFEESGKGYGPAWIFDGKTAVVAQAKTKEKPKPGLLRTTDGGKTFQPCGDYFAVALPKWRGDTLYWLVEGALIKTTDAGKSWDKVCDLKDGRYGPIFGKDAMQMFILTNGGVIESTDGGATWSQPLAVPKEMKGISSLTWMDFDPVNDVLYIMKMGTDKVVSDLYRIERGKK